MCIACEKGQTVPSKLESQFEKESNRMTCWGEFPSTGPTITAWESSLRKSGRSPSELANTAALFARAEAIGAHYALDLAMQERHLGDRLAELDRLIEGADDIYLTIDLDVLPAGVAPGVSAPAALGVPLAVVEAMVMRLRTSSKLRVADIAEYNPEYDQDNRTARAAARLLYRLL